MIFESNSRDAPSPAISVEHEHDGRMVEGKDGSVSDRQRSVDSCSFDRSCTNHRIGRDWAPGHEPFHRRLSRSADCTAKTIFEIMPPSGLAIPASRSSEGGSSKHLWPSPTGTARHWPVFTPPGSAKYGRSSGGRVITCNNKHEASGRPSLARTSGRFLHPADDTNSAKDMFALRSAYPAGAVIQTNTRCAPPIIKGHWVDPDRCAIRVYPTRVVRSRRTRARKGSVR